MQTVNAILNYRNQEEEELQTAMVELLKLHEELEEKKKVEAEQEDIKKYYFALSQNKGIPKETGKVTDDFDEMPEEKEVEEEFIDEDEDKKE